MNLIICIGHVDHQRVAVLVKLTLNGQRAEVLGLIVGNLLAVHRQRLREIAKTIEKTDGTHVNVRVAGLLHIVASEHAQTTRIDLQGRVHTIFHAEIGYRRALGIGLHVHIFTEQVVHILNALHQCLILHNLFFAGKAQAFQQHDRIVLHLMIKLRVEVTEQVACLVVPYPPHVMGNLVQTL